MKSAILAALLTTASSAAAFTPSNGMVRRSYQLRSSAEDDAMEVDPALAAVIKEAAAESAAVESAAEPVAEMAILTPSGGGAAAALSAIPEAVTMEAAAVIATPAFEEQVLTTSATGEATLVMSESMPFMEERVNLAGYIGNVGFDPFGFSDDIKMEFLREAEIKHGRVCMLAWLGWVSVDLGARLDSLPEGYESLNSLGAYKAFYAESNEPFIYSPLGLILECIAVPEVLQLWNVWNMAAGRPADRPAGDLNCAFGILDESTPEQIELMKYKELKHCRLGMLAFAGVVVQSTVIGADQFPYF